MDQSFKNEKEMATCSVVSLVSKGCETRETLHANELSLLTADVTCNSDPSENCCVSLNSKSVEPLTSKVLKPYPYFYYRDFSRVPDPDPLIPLTGPGHLPKFPAKMHSILSRDDLSHIVCWMPHGRSWRVLKPEEFERRVIPTYVSSLILLSGRLGADEDRAQTHLSL
jgi:hypothetical protein